MYPQEMVSVNTIAITRTAMMSSTMARVSKKIFKPNGTREPNNARIPTTKAISVAMGIAQPRWPGWAHCIAV